MAVNYTDVQKTEKYISRTNFDALEMAAVPEGTEFNIVDSIHESDLDSDILQKLNNNAKINTANTFTAAQTFKKDITIEGNIIQNGSAYETHAEKLYTKNDMIYTRDGATAALADNAYTGIQAVKYDGTNDGQLVFGKDGVARVGDIGNTQPLATRAEAGALVDEHLLQWDAAGQTLVDSGKSVSDFATTGDIPDTSNFAKLTDLVQDPTKTYLVWKGSKFPDSTLSEFKAPANSTIDWGDGTVETFTTVSTSVNTHTYSDGIDYHLITMSGLTSIDVKAFFDSSGLTSATIGNSVTSIDSSGFSSCRGLTSVTIPNSVTSIGGSAFDSCSELTNIAIPDSVTSIGRMAFANCSKLTSITIPNSVTSMGRGPFGNCSKLTSATIGNGMTSIIDHMFTMCGELTSITIPDSVTSIGDYAFSSCNKLKKVIVKATSVPTLDSSSFPNSIEKIVVPKSAINAYKAASNWSSYADKIVYEVDSSDLSSGGGDVTAAGNNTFTGNNKFEGTVNFSSITAGAVSFAGKPSFNAGIELVTGVISFRDKTATLPSATGTLALADDNLGNVIQFKENTLIGSKCSLIRDVTTWIKNGYGSYCSPGYLVAGFGSGDSSSAAGTTAIGPNGLYKLGTTANTLKFALPDVVTTDNTLALVSDLPVANPSDAGTATLTKLKVGDMVYNLPSGGGSGDVTAAGNNTFTGTNTFNKSIILGREGTASLKVSDEDLSGMYSTLTYNNLSFNYPSSNLSLNVSYNSIQSIAKSSDGAITLADTTLKFGQNGSTATVTIPNKTGTLAIAEDIPISSATLSDNDTTLTLVLR